MASKKKQKKKTKRQPKRPKEKSKLEQLKEKQSNLYLRVKEYRDWETSTTRSARKSIARKTKTSTRRRSKEKEKGATIIKENRYSNIKHKSTMYYR